MEKLNGAYTRFADVYDLLMGETDYDMWADYLASFINGQSVLDCACGTGAVTVRLAKAGFSLTGLDSSTDMLRAAGEKARSAGLRIPFINQDMTSIRLHRPVDAIVCACDGVNYLTCDGRLESFLKSAYNSLNPGGCLLFDTSSVYKFAHVLDGNTFGEAGEECAYIWRNSYSSPLCEMELTCFIKKGMLYERFDERHVQRAFSIDEIKTALAGAGFEYINVYGGFTREYPNESCERVQYAAVKPGDNNAGQ